MLFGTGPLPVRQSTLLPSRGLGVSCEQDVGVVRFLYSEPVDSMGRPEMYAERRGFQASTVTL